MAHQISVRPEEIPKTVEFLPSPDAGFITGVELFVDGSAAWFRLGASNPMSHSSQTEKP
jgi:hypothetical protein